MTRRDLLRSGNDRGTGTGSGIIDGKDVVVKNRFLATASDRA